jgi:hypothetical protein
VQGRDGCERCARHGLTCDLPPAKLQALQYINLEDSTSDGNAAEQQSSTSSSDAALFEESSFTQYIPESIGKLSRSDWAAARQAMFAKVCDILAHADSELFEVGRMLSAGMELKLTRYCRHSKARFRVQSSSRNYWKYTFLPSTPTCPWYTQRHSIRRQVPGSSPSH